MWNEPHKHTDSYQPWPLTSYTHCCFHQTAGGFQLPVARSGKEEKRDGDIRDRDKKWEMDGLQVCRHSVTAVGLIKYPRQIEQVMYRLKSRTRCFRWAAISTRRSQRSGDHKLESRHYPRLPRRFHSCLHFKAVGTQIWKHVCSDDDPSYEKDVYIWGNTQTRLLQTFTSHFMSPLFKWKMITHSVWKADMSCTPESLEKVYRSWKVFFSLTASGKVPVRRRES